MDDLFMSIHYRGHVVHIRVRVDDQKNLFYRAHGSNLVGTWCYMWQTVIEEAKEYIDEQEANKKR